MTYTYDTYSKNEENNTCHVYSKGSTSDRGDETVIINMDYWQAIQLVALLNEIQLAPDEVRALRERKGFRK